MVRLSDPNTGKLMREFVPCPISSTPVAAAGRN
jgi:hypothetical protein